MTKLRLPPLPKSQTVKVTVSLSAELNAALEQYAELHSQVSGERNDLTRLIPYMLEAFIESDRAFRASRRAERTKPITERGR
jgi:hypothetical protein